MKYFLLFTLAIAMTIATPAQTLHDFNLVDIDGNPVSLSEYSGKAVLVVNVASMCGYTRQYADLQALYEKHEKDGLVILGVPANDFGAQEPGTNAEIKEFCTTNFNVTFPMFSKVTVKGPNKVELYAWLTSGAGNENLSGEVRWNFEKFLIDKDGKLVNRFASSVEVDDEEFQTAVNTALAQ